MTKGWEFDSSQRQDFFLFCMAFRPLVGPTHPPILCVLRVNGHSPSSNVEVKNVKMCTPTAPSLCHGVNWAHLSTVFSGTFIWRNRLVQEHCIWSCLLDIRTLQVNLGHIFHIQFIFVNSAIIFNFFILYPVMFSSYKTNKCFVCLISVSAPITVFI
jgi:hypothetical protein